MKYTLGSFAPSNIFHNQHKTLNNLYIFDSPRLAKVGQACQTYTKHLHKTNNFDGRN